MWMNITPQLTIGIFGVQLIVIFVLIIFAYGEMNEREKVIEEKEKVIEENKDLKRRLGRES